MVIPDPVHREVALVIAADHQALPGLQLYFGQVVPAVRVLYPGGPGAAVRFVADGPHIAAYVQDGGGQSPFFGFLGGLLHRPAFGDSSHIQLQVRVGKVYGPGVFLQH